MLKHVALEDRTLAGSRGEATDAFGGLEPLESRVLLSAVQKVSLPPDAIITAIAVSPLAEAEPLVITAESVTIDQALASQIVQALQAGRDVQIEATAGDVTVDAAIVAAMGADNADLHITATGVIEINAAIRSTGNTGGELNVNLDASNNNDSAVAVNANVVVNGLFTATTFTFVQQAGTTINTGDRIQIIAQGTSNALDGSDDTLIVDGTIVAAGRIELSSLGNLVVTGVVRSDVAAAVSPESDPFAVDPAVLVQVSGIDSHADISGVVAASQGSVMVSTATLLLDGTLRSNRGHVTFTGEELRTTADSLIEATDGDVVIIGQIFQSTVLGRIRAIGDSRADVDLRLTLSAEFIVASSALIETEGGSVKLAAGKLIVDGTVNTNGGAIAFDAESGQIDITGRVTTGRITTTESDERGGDIDITVNGGSIFLNGTLASNGGNITFIVRNGVSVDAQSFFDASLDRTRISGITLGSNAVVDSRFAGGIGGTITFDIGESNLVILPGAAILSGGGDVIVKATGSYQTYSVDPDGDGPKGVEERTQFFSSLVKIDGIINTFSPTYGAGELSIPTEGVQLLLGTAEGSKFRLAAGTQVVTITSLTTPDSDQPARGGSATINGIITAGQVTVQTQGLLNLTGQLTATDIDLAASLLRVAGSTAVTSLSGDVTIDAGVQGVNAARNRNARKKAKKKTGSSLSVNAAGNAFIGGDITGLQNVSLQSGGLIEFDRPVAPAAVAASTAPIRLASKGSLTINARTLLARDHGLTIKSKKSDLKLNRTLSIFTEGDIVIDAPDSKLKAVHLVTTGSVQLDLEQLRIAGGGIFANNAITLDIDRIVGSPFTASNVSGNVDVDAGATSRKVKTSALAIPIDPATFDDPQPVFNIGGSDIPVIL